jgi:hypothetical protein
LLTMTTKSEVGAYGKVALVFHTVTAPAAAAHHSKSSLSAQQLHMCDRHNATVKLLISVCSCGPSQPCDSALEAAAQRNDVQERCAGPMWCRTAQLHLNISYLTLHDVCLVLLTIVVDDHVWSSHACRQGHMQSAHTATEQ